MTIEPHLNAAPNHDLGDPLSLAQKEALQRAVAKIVALGAQAGVTTDQMIQLLHSGLTVGELLEFLAARSGEVA
jgi:hypothetical protein